MQFLNMRIYAYQRVMRDPGIEYLRHVLEKKGWTAADLARRAGLAHSTINRPLTKPNYEMGISRRTLEKVYLASGIDPAAFFDGLPSTAIMKPEVGTELIPLFDISAAAGNGSSLVEYEAIVEQLSFPRDYLRHITQTPSEHLGIISVTGNSMSPTLHHDDIVMVDSTKKNISYDGMFVIRYDDLLRVKRLRWGSGRETILMISDNEIHHPREEVSASEVDVIGRVVWIGAKQP